MSAAKVAVTIDAALLEEVDRWVAAGEFPNRGKALQAGLHRICQQRTSRNTLLRELALLDVTDERDLAEERLGGEVA